MKRIFTSAIPIIIIFIVATSCATTGRYQDKASEVFEDIEFADFNQASTRIDQISFYQKDRNRLLYLLEKAKVEHMRGNYRSSNGYFEQAYILVDDGIKNSVGQVALSNLANPMMTKYKGEDFEKVMIHYYKALNYYYLGIPDTALIEARRINIKLNELNDRYDDHKNKYQYDAFAQILQGAIYESTGNLNDAFIAYRNAEKIYEDHDGVYLNVSTPEQLKKDLLRTSKAIGFGEEYAHLKKKYPAVKEDENTAAAIVFWENGTGPKKSQMMMTANSVEGVFVGTYSDDQTTIVIPIPAGINIGFNAIAFPEYVKGKNYFHRASVAIDGQQKDFELAEDFNAIAKQALKDRAMREVAKTVVRFATKKGIGRGLKALANHYGGGIAGDITGMVTDAVGAAVEKADTRNWQSLPSQISYVRLALPTEGEKKAVMTKYAENGNVVDTLVLKAGKSSHLISLFDMSNMGYYGKQTQMANTSTQVDTEVTNAALLAAGNTLSGANGELLTALLTASAGNSPAVRVKEAKSIPDDVVDYVSIGISATPFGFGALRTEGLSDVFDGARATWQAEALLGFNKGAARSTLGLSLGLANYADPWVDEDPDKTTDLSAGFLYKIYTGRTKGYYLTGFNLFVQPSLRYSIASNIYSDGYYDYDMEEYVYLDGRKIEKPFDVGIKTGMGYAWSVGRNRMSRMAASIFLDAGLLERESAYGYKTGFFGVQLSFDYGL